MKKNLQVLAAAATALLCMAQGVVAQKAAKKKAPVRPIIFAVIDDGKDVSPIALFAGGKYYEPTNGGATSAELKAFGKAYYRPNSVYRLIFGGVDAGTVKISEFDPQAECGKNMATVAVDSANVKPKGFLMALATNVPERSKRASFRKRPTAAEKSEVEDLVRDVYKKNKLTPETLRYHNLTAIDVDGDGVAELVGSYWVDVDSTTRALLFFIANKSGGKYHLSYSDFRKIAQNDTMSAEIKDVDEGVYHEMLLDYFDADGDGKAEIYTYTRSFEGAEFNIYSFAAGKWSKKYTFNDYRCAF